MSPKFGLDSRSDCPWVVFILSCKTMIQSWIKHFLNYAGYVNQPISYLFFNTYTVYIYIEYSLEVFLDISSIFPTSILGSVPLVLKSTYPSIWRQLWFCLWGFTSGAAIIIGLSQLKNMLGIHLDKFRNLSAGGGQGETWVEGQWRSWKKHRRLLESVRVWCVFLSLLSFFGWEKNQSKGTVVLKDNISNYQEGLVESLAVLLGMVGLHLQNGHCNYTLVFPEYWANGG